MKIVASLLVLGAASVMSVGSAVAGSPFIGFMSEGVRQMVEIPWYTDANGIARVDHWEYRTSEYSIRVHDVAMDPDPSIAYAVAVTDFGAPSTFSFLFGTPIVPTGSPNIVYGSLVGGLTDFTGNGVSLTPTGATVQSSSVDFFPGTNMGIDVGAAFAAGPGTPGALYSYGPYSTGPVAGPGPGPWTWLNVYTSFTMSGGDDMAALTGFTSIVEGANPVPEPTSVALMGGGLLALALAVRRKKALGR